MWRIDLVQEGNATRFIQWRDSQKSLSLCGFEYEVPCTEVESVLIPNSMLFNRQFVDAVICLNE